jgi:LIVCS family branched-chain amino acid:cation transporter
MKQFGLIVSSGLAMFSMFFGSGNLVFPILAGSSGGDFAFMSFLGFFLTAVLVPFSGIFAMFLYQGDSKFFFSRLGNKAAIIVPFLILGLMGPFGVLARCITVAHGAYKLIDSGLSLEVFSFISVAIIFLFTTRKNKIVSLLGVILTPFLLISLAAITGFGLTQTPIEQQINSGNPLDSFVNGLHLGYQTMDLLASFFFSSFLIHHLQKNKGASLNTFLTSSVVGSFLLSIVYLSLILLGAKYQFALQGVAPQEMLAKIAMMTLGAWAGPVVSITVILACLTTTIVLASLFADFLKKDLLKDSISGALSLVITLGIAFVVSTLDFMGIMRVLGPIVEFAYPLLIGFTLLRIVETVAFRIRKA